MIATPMKNQFMITNLFYNGRYAKSQDASYSTGYRISEVVEQRSFPNEIGIKGWERGTVFGYFSVPRSYWY